MNLNFFTEIQYTLNLDSEITSKGSKRVYFPEDPKYERTGSLNLTAKNVTSCVDFPFIHIVVGMRMLSTGGFTDWLKIVSMQQMIRL